VVLRAGALKKYRSQVDGLSMLDQGRGRLIPYYLYVSTVATVWLPVGAMSLPTFRNGEGTGVVQLAYAVAAVHLFVVAGMLLADWRGAIRQLRGISRIQARRWVWCRILCRIMYRDTVGWWRSVAMLFFVPAGLLCVIFAYGIR
jgi:hypothetical protein